MLGNPPRMFGFSTTRSFGLQWAREECARQAGDVTLALLDTSFDDVLAYVTSAYPDKHFWVDAGWNSANTSK